MIIFIYFTREYLSFTFYCLAWSERIGPNFKRRRCNLGPKEKKKMEETINVGAPVLMVQVGPAQIKLLRTVDLNKYKSPVGQGSFPCKKELKKASARPG